MSRDEEIVLRDVSNAGLVVSDRIARDAATHLDLEESLEAARYASHPYSAHPKEWPPLVEMLDAWELPPVLIERYGAAGGEGTALCGIFPEIRRAWATWIHLSEKFLESNLATIETIHEDGQCPEYSGEEQAICAVGLARSKPGVFVEAIQYLLILATPIELILVGVCCTGRGDGTDPYAEVSLQPLPEYTIPSDGVTMTCVACTSKGQIFLAGRDGHVYEVQYTTGSGWNKRCRKICLTAGLGSLVSRYIVTGRFMWPWTMVDELGDVGLVFRWVVPNVFRFGTVDPIVEMIVDNERHILYARTEEMKVQVFDLRASGGGSLKKVAEARNIINQRDSQYGGRQPTGSRAASQTGKISIVSMTPLSTVESKWLHLVAILSDGRRMYLSTSSSGGNNGSLGGFGRLNHPHQRPCCIKVVTTRPPPPLSVGAGVNFGSLAGRSQSEDLSLKVETAYYSSGTAVFSDSSPPTMSSLLIVNRDASTQSSQTGGLVMSGRSSGALRETVSSLPVEGRMLFVADVLPLPETAEIVQSLYSDLELCGFVDSGESCERATTKLWARGDLATQHILPRKKVVVFSTMGMMDVVFNRPVDILQKLLESNTTRSVVEDFFNRLGAGEAAAMCLMLAARIVHTENPISNSVSEKAAEAFEDPRLVGMPQLEGVRAMECIRQLLLRSAEALFLLQLLSLHHVTRLIQGFPSNLRQSLIQLTFHQLVGSEEGDQLATRLMSGLMEYYTGSDGRGTVDDISRRLRDGCPSYFKESDYKFYLAVECLEKAAVTADSEKEYLAREAFNLLTKIPESADLTTICRRFEDLRFYEAVVRLPLQKAQALDPAGDAFNEQIDAGIRESILAQRKQCYEIIICALRNLKGETGQKEPGSPIRHAVKRLVLDKAARNRYICQIVQLGVQSPDRAFHEHLYRAMIDLGLENELLEYGGPDLVSFLQKAGQQSMHELRAVSSVTSATSPLGNLGGRITTKQTKYLDLLARYYVLKRQHVLAAHILLRLAERHSSDSEDVPTLEQRRQYLCNAVLQAKNASNYEGMTGSIHGTSENALLDLLDGKLAVLRFQMKIKEELDAISLRAEGSSAMSESTSSDPFPQGPLVADANLAQAAREKAKELSLDLKSITQLYNEYAVPFELWEICLEILYFANYSGDADFSILRETWARLIDQALSRGGIAEACSVLKRVGPNVYPGEGAGLPLDTLSLHLEKAALVLYFNSLLFML
ncbi:hypothetical protein Sjap_010733 [Stephania japonica]|uniref:Nuclear pore complex protein NUP155 n=1 Tax=Stephania japonica TaxID=461633 RepID=A0AAP0JC10_9MAGN